MRSGLFKKVRFADALLNQLVANIADAITTLTGDDDVLSAPATVLVATGKVPAGASTVLYRGGAGAQLTLPAAASSTSQGGARAVLVAFANESTATVALLASGSDTINGAKSLIVAAGTLKMLLADGIDRWLVT